MPEVNIQVAATMESTRQSADRGELFRIWNGELYQETIDALTAAGVVVVPNCNAADPTKQYVFYNIQVLAS